MTQVGTLVPVADAARLARIPRGAIYRWLRGGKIAAHPGRHAVVSIDDVLRHRARLRSGVLWPLACWIADRGGASLADVAEHYAIPYQTAGARVSMARDEGWLLPAWTLVPAVDEVPDDLAGRPRQVLARLIDDGPMTRRDLRRRAEIPDATLKVCITTLWRRGLIRNPRHIHSVEEL